MKHLITCHQRLLYLTAAVASALGADAQSHAQSVDDNVVRQADTAFGVSVGGESIGLYSASQARGFSPVDAGNVRLEGLYMDRPAPFTGRLVRGNQVRVGLGAISELFPAPSGVVDFRLYDIGAEARVNVAAETDTLGAFYIQGDGQAPLGDDLGLSAGAGLYFNETAGGSDETVLVLSASPEWRPAEGLRIRPFWSVIEKTGSEPETVFRVENDQFPAFPPNARRLAPDWAKARFGYRNGGLIASWEAGAFLWKAGLFRSVQDFDRQFSHFIRYDGDAFSGARVVASRDHKFASTSGELRGTYRFSTSDLSQQVSLSLRARDRQRVYARTDGVDIAPPSTDYARTPVSEPKFAFRAPSRDTIEQATFAAGYFASWRGRVDVKFGVQQTFYGKDTTAGDGLRTEAKDDAILVSAALAGRLTESLTLFAGYTEGLEEGNTAPDVAANRGEATNAVITSQREAGLRYRFSDAFDLQAGLFDIKKPYDALDAMQRFRRIGELRHQGVELSITSTPVDGLTFVAGSVYLDAEVSGEQVDRGEVGARAINAPEVLIIASADYALPQLDGLSFDLSAEYRSDVQANTANSFTLPGRTIVDLGARYRFETGEIPFLLRLELANAFNKRAWDVAASNAFRPNSPRILFIRLSADL